MHHDLPRSRKDLPFSPSAWLGPGGLEPHRSIIHAAEVKHRKILHVVLVYAPGRFLTLLRQGVERAPHVPGIELDGVFRHDLATFMTLKALRQNHGCASPSQWSNALLVQADEAVLSSSRPSFRRKPVGIVCGGRNW